MLLKYYTHILAGLLAGALLSSCGMTNGIKTFANNYSSIPFMYRLTDTIGTNMTKKIAALGTTLKDTLLDDNSQQRINLLVNRIMHTLSLHADTIKDSVLGKGTRQALIILRDSLLGNGTKDRLSLIRNDLLGRKTNNYLGLIRDNLLGDTTKNKLVAIRNGVLDTSLNKDIDTLITKAIVALGMAYEKNISPKLQADLSKAQNAGKQTLSDLTEFLLILGALLIGIAVAVIFIIRSWKDRQALQVVTNKIYQLPDNETKQEIVSGIRKAATSTGVESHLHKFLQKRRMLTSNPANT